MSDSPAGGDLRRYRNPPIEEAACEFRFRPGRDWDLTIPGRLHTRLADDYPGPPREHRTAELIPAASGGPVGGVTARQGLSRVHLVTADARRLVGVGKDVLSIHLLRPYRTDGESLRGWEEFRDRIETALDAYWRVAEPVSIQHLRLRYLNRFSVPHGSRSLRVFLRGVPESLPEVPDGAGRYFSSSEYGDENGIGYRVLHGISPPANGRRQVILDIEAARAEDAGLSREAGMEWAERLRVGERQVFEAIITDETRSLFDAE